MRTLVICLSNTSEYEERLHLLLCQRLVLKAISESKSELIAFWGCPKLANTFSCTSQSHHPDLRTTWALTVLGSPPWLDAEASPWTEWMKVNQSLTGYITKRLGEQLSNEAAALTIGGLAKTTAVRWLQVHSYLELKNEAIFIKEALKQKYKITQIGEIFKQKKQVEAVLAATIAASSPLSTTPIKELLHSLSTV